MERALVCQPRPHVIAHARRQMHAWHRTEARPHGSPLAVSLGSPGSLILNHSPCAPAASPVVLTAQPPQCSNLKPITCCHGTRSGLASTLGAPGARGNKRITHQEDAAATRRLDKVHARYGITPVVPPPPADADRSTAICRGR